VALPVPFRREIFVNAVWKSVDLICHECQQRNGWPLAGAQRAAREMQIAEHQCVAEPIVLATVSADCGVISVG
jgi:hypothetical protein